MNIARIVLNLWNRYMGPSRKTSWGGVAKLIGAVIALLGVWASGEAITEERVSVVVGLAIAFGGSLLTSFAARDEERPPDPPGR